jgi:hypothetical protein
MAVIPGMWEAVVSRKSTSGKNMKPYSKNIVWDAGHGRRGRRGVWDSYQV